MNNRFLRFRPKTTSPGPVAIPDRVKIADTYKWNPGILFSDARAWERERSALVREIPRLRQFQGHLAESPEALRRCLDAVSNVRHRLERLSAYASRLHDTDMRITRHQALTSAAEKLATDFLSATSFMDPELLAQPVTRLRAFSKSAVLGDYDRFLEDRIRLKDHVLTGPEEAVLAGASALGTVTYHVQQTFSNAEMEHPIIEDAAGRKVVLSAAMYARYRQSPQREQRRRVFEAYWGNHAKYRNTFAQMLAGQVSYYDFVAKARRYPDPLTAALMPEAIPPAFYGNLIRSVTAHLGAFHRYLRLRGRLLGIEGPQRYYDIYPMAVAQGHRKYTFEQSRTIIGRSMRPLGRDYGRRLKEAMADGSGWLDVFPNQGKRSGAYSSSVYDHHPLVLLNFNEDFDSLSTMTHELGHAIHSAYSNDAQPYPKSDYSLFNAEVASIFNETLLIEHLLSEERHPDERRFLLSAYLDSFRGTVFRQTLFAEFELAIYRRVSSGKTLTADSLSRLYLGLLRRYHGHAEGIMRIDPLYGIEWAYIPHFYYNFYVYQYVSGFVAATALAKRVLEKGAPAARQYIREMLEAGCARDPLTILKRAGVDMMRPGPYAMAIGQFTSRVRELESLAGGGA